MIKTFALIFGVLYVLIGILGFIPGMSQHTADMPRIAVEQSYGKLMGLFPVNILHNIVHLAIGAWGLLSSRSVGAARLYGKVLAVFYGLLTILGLIPNEGANTMMGLVPIFGHDVWLHGVSAIIAGYFGWLARDSDAAPTGAGV